MRELLVLLACVLGWPALAAAQINVDANILRLGSAPCAFSTGSGAPSSGATCDTYLDTSAGDLYVKNTSGTWLKVVASWAAHDLLVGEGSGTAPNTLAGGTNCVAWWTNSSSDPTCNNDPTLSGALFTSSDVKSTSYASQTTGWDITIAGAADFRYLFANELRILLFTAEQEAVLAGALRVSKSYSTISQTFTCPALGGSTTLWVNDSPTFSGAAVFVSGDSVFIHALSRTALGGFSVSDCVGAVTTYSQSSGTQSWTFTRYASSANGGSMTGGTTVAVNQLVQDLGVSGNGYLEAIADDGSNNVNAPYYQVVTWASAPTATNTTVRCRLGQLTGITSTSEYGLLCGNYGGNAYVRFTDQNAEIKGIPLSLLASGTTTIKLDPSVPAIELGNPLPTGLMSGTGIWMGNNSGTYGFRAGNPSGDYFEWDGSHAIVHSSNLTIDNTNGVQMAISTSGAANTFAYGFTTGFAGSNSQGLFGSENPGAGIRIIDILNNTTTTGKINEVVLQTSVNGSGTTLSVVTDSTIPDYFGQINGRWQAGAPDTFDLGSNSDFWRTLYIDSITLTDPNDGGIIMNMTNAASALTAILFQFHGSVVGSVVVNGSGTTYYTTSDKRLKTNVKPTQLGIADLRKVNVDDFSFIPSIDPTGATHNGVLAQEMALVYPDAVLQPADPNATWMVDYGRLTPLIIKGVQDLDAAVTALTARVAALEAKGKE